MQVPYGCLVPPGVRNLLVGGRAVAGDKASHTAMRNMMACTVTGQGAGVAAAVSIKVRFSKVVLVCKTRNRAGYEGEDSDVHKCNILQEACVVCCRLVGCSNPPPRPRIASP